MNKYASDLVDLTVTLLRTSERAMMVRDGAGTEAWLPLSQVEVSGKMETGRAIEATAPQWLVEEKGLE